MYLGLDLGTSGIKALLMNDQQQLIASASAPLSVNRPHSGWSEQDPASWITACQQAVYRLREDHPAALSAVRSIGLSGQMHGATLINARGQPLRPCILWNDTRSFQEAASLDAQPEFRSVSGNIVFPGFTAPKLCWVARHESALFQQVHKVLLPKDYLRYWLTGDYVSDLSDASGTSWLDVGRRDWCDDLLARSGMQRHQMPALVEGTRISGELRPELARDWGMGRVVVAGGGGDNAASAVGMGVVQAGEAFLSLGTSGVLFAANEQYQPNPDSAVHTFCHALPGRWHQMGVILSATDALNWYASSVGKTAFELTSQLEQAGTAPQRPSSVTFLPYLSGERTPHNDAHIRGAFLNLAHQTSQTDLTQAVLEGVAFAMCDSLRALQAAGTELQHIRVVGGGSRSRYWLNIMASVLNQPLDIPADGDFGGAFGAARLALIAAHNSDPAEVCQPPAIIDRIEPDAGLHAAYGERYQAYRAAYPLLRQLGSH